MNKYASLALTASQRSVLAPLASVLETVHRHQIVNQYMCSMERLRHIAGITGADSVDSSILIPSPDFLVLSQMGPIAAYRVVDTRWAKRWPELAEMEGIMRVVGGMNDHVYPVTPGQRMFHSPGGQSVHVPNVAGMSDTLVEIRTHFRDVGVP